MKKTFKLINLVVITLLLTIFSCNNDDETAPINLQDLEVTIDENPTNGDVIGTMQTNSTATLVYSITAQTPEGAITINTSTGELTVADATLFNFEVNPVITATVSVEGAVNTANVTINIANVNELSIQDLTTTKHENSPNGDDIGIVMATGDGTLSFSITSQSPAGAVSINANTGVLLVANTALFDFETNPSITANIMVNNSVSSETATVTINLININEIGDFNHGGVVFYLDGNGGGLVCNITDLNEGNVIQWGNNGIEYQATGANATAIGSGQANTNAIINTQGAGNYAASLCDNLTLNGYSDWYLPSKDELNEMFIKFPIINSVATANGGNSFAIFYWSSTQATSNTNVAWIQFFQSGSQSINNKLNTSYVRAIRAF